MNDNNFNLNTDIVNNPDKTYTSLLDQYNVSLFTDEQIQKQQSDRAQLIRKDENVRNRIFLNREIENRNDFDYSTLFLEPLTLIKKESYVEENSDSNAFVMIGAVVILLVFFIVMIKTLKKDRKKGENTIG